MPPAVKLPLKPGPLKVAFQGTPPQVQYVADDSPYKGKIKKGFVFLALILDDGTEIENLSTPDLVAALNEHSDMEGRKLKMKMGLPDETEAVLPAGDYGAIIEDIEDVPIITKIAATSPLKTHLRVGLMVEKVKLEDGTIATGFKSEELTELLEDDIETSGRKLYLKNPAKYPLPPKNFKLPAYKVVELPTGPLLTSFKGVKKCTVAKMREDSPMRGQLRVGMAVDSFRLSDSTELSGLSAVELGELLKDTSEMEGRALILRAPESKELPKKSTTKVYLPSIGTAEDFGLQFEGDPAMVAGVDESSPVYDYCRPGQVALTCGYEDGPEFDSLDAQELTEALEESSGETGRFILFENGAVPMPDESIVTLPAGKLGCVFKGIPPRITKVNATSPIRRKVMVGMVADTLTLEDETLYEMTTREFTEALTENSSSTNRVVRFINPTTMELTESPVADLEDELEITLPTGKLGVTFQGVFPTRVAGVSKKSPLREMIGVGMAVDTLTVGKTVYMQQDAVALVGTLGATTDVEDRVLLLKNPDQEGVEFSQLPDTLELALPPTKLSIVFKGDPPFPTKIKDESPLIGEVLPGMFVDMLTVEDGTVFTGFTATKLVQLLKESVGEEERTLLLKNPATREPSPEGMVLPDEKTIELPTGKLGLSLKGKRIAKATRIHDTSQLRGLVRPGMAVDTIELQDGTIYAGLSAAEAVRVLIDTSDQEGRLMTLKNPDTAEFTPRNVATDAGDGGVVADGQDVPEEISQRG